MKTPYKILIYQYLFKNIIAFKVQDKGIQVRYENENLWLTQKSMAELFAFSTNNMSLH